MNPKECRKRTDGINRKHIKIFNSQIKYDRFKPNIPIITLNINGLNTPN